MNTTPGTARWALRFLGVGNASATELGAASIVLECDDAPVLMVDCGQEALDAYLQHYQQPPPAVFLTHVHFDHIAGFERLFVQNHFSRKPRPRTRLYVPANLLPLLQERSGNYPNTVAEGGVNFWDAFHLVPLAYGFWHHGLWLDVFPVRHHVPGTAFGLCLAGCFLYTGDTRPIPEVLALYADGRMPLVHDCDRVGNPSHTGLADVLRDYPEALRRQLVAYHYGSAEDGHALAAAGLRVAKPGDILTLSSPGDSNAAHEAAVRRRLGVPTDDS